VKLVLLSDTHTMHEREFIENPPKPSEALIALMKKGNP